MSLIKALQKPIPGKIEAVRLQKAHKVQYLVDVLENIFCHSHSPMKSKSPKSKLVHQNYDHQRSVAILNLAFCFNFYKS